MDYGIAILSGVIDLIIFGNNDTREVGAIFESAAPNLRHRWGDDQVLYFFSVEIQMIV
jgi:hypothetical protein